MKEPQHRDLVSVIIPTYNRACLVKEAIESVRSQTWKSVEIIVVDDGSTDNTRQVVEAVPNILYLRQERRGQAAARNLGLRHAKGSYICSLDSDDLWHPKFLQPCVAAVGALNADFVFANWMAVKGDGTNYRSYFEDIYHWWDFPETRHEGWRIMEPHASRAIYLDSCASPSSALLFKRSSIVSGWSEQLKIADDWCLILDAVLSKPCRVAFTMERLWTKRVLGDNIYDQQNTIEVAGKLGVDDSWRMMVRHTKLLCRDEKARLYRRLAAAGFYMIRADWQTKKLRTMPRSFIHTLRATYGAVTSDPQHFFRKHVLRKVPAGGAKQFRAMEWRGSTPLPAGD
jgi:hypothetical protein